VSPAQLAALVVLVILLAGCESTMDKSARLAKQATGAAADKPLAIGATNRAIRVERRIVLHDEYGTAVALLLHNRGRRDQVAVPVAATVGDYSTAAAGLAPSLNHVPVLEAGERTWWVNDQVTADKGRLKARIGTSTERAPAKLPRITVGRLRAERDADGVFHRGRVTNHSGIAQVQLILFAVARRGGEVVAAGRAGIERLKAGKSAPFRIYWIGDPRGAAITVTAPPSTLEDA